MFTYNPPAHDKLTILHHDDSILIVDKPSGLLSVPGRGPDKQDCMISRVQKTFPQALIVHRLDMATSGILVLALDRETHRLLSKQFQERQITKQYIAVVVGKIDNAIGVIDKPMICDWPNRPKQIIDMQQGKAAQTHYEVLSYSVDDNTSRLLLTPITGRTHQLRLHCQYIGHPILGDQLYGDNNAREMAQRLLLHASGVRFNHPISQQVIDIKTNIPF